jgi:hypothetical protein
MGNNRRTHTEDGNGSKADITANTLTEAVDIYKAHFDDSPPLTCYYGNDRSEEDLIKLVLDAVKRNKKVPLPFKPEKGELY